MQVEAGPLMGAAAISVTLVGGAVWAVTFLAANPGLDPAIFATGLTLISVPVMLVGLAAVGVGFLAALSYRPKFRFDSVFTTDVGGVISVHGRRGARREQLIGLNLNGVGFVEADVDPVNGDHLLRLFRTRPADDSSAARQAVFVRCTALNWLEQPMVADAFADLFAAHALTAQITGSISPLVSPALDRETAH